MTLETPNQLHAGLVAFYAEPASLPGGANPAEFTVTASQGIQSVAFPPAPTFSGTFTDGLMVRLQEPVHVAEGVWFMNGWQVEETIDEEIYVGLTPSTVQLNTGEPSVDLFGSEIGNWLNLDADPFNPFGFFTLSIFELPQIDTAELPAFPLAAS